MFGKPGQPILRGYMRNFSRGRAQLFGCLSTLLVLVSNPVPTLRAARLAPAETFAETLAHRINLFRRENGKPPLRINPSLTLAADRHSTAMAAQNFFSHRDPTTGCNSPGARASSAGYDDWTSILETLAAGQPTADEAFDAFAASPAHRMTLLNEAVREFGVGYMLENDDGANIRLSAAGDCTFGPATEGPFVHYWTVVFGARTLADAVTPLLPVIIDNEAPGVNTRDIVLYVHTQANASTQVRVFSDGCWTEWMAWQPEFRSRLSAGTGNKSVTAEIRTGGVIQTATDSVQLDDPRTTLNPLNICTKQTLTQHTLLPLTTRK